MLGALRRPQTAADRGPESRYALNFQGNKTYADVRLPYVRYAAVGPGERGVVLIPAGSHRRSSDQAAQTEVVCTWRVSYFQGKPEGGAPGCWQADDIRSGRAIHQVDGRVDMLVPDHVSRVEGVTGSGRVATATPRDNVASWDGPLPTQVLWFDERGAQLRRIAY
jgi:hypothetical protein